jgi:hypothetical protein
MELCVSAKVSFVIFFYLNYMCEIIEVYLMIGLCFECVVFVIFGRFCRVFGLWGVLLSIFWVLLVLQMEYVLYMGLKKYLLHAVQHMWVDIHFILIGMFHFDYMCLLFFPLVLGGFIY